MGNKFAARRPSRGLGPTPLAAGGGAGGLGSAPGLRLPGRSRRHVAAFGSRAGRSGTTAAPRWQGGSAALDRSRKAEHSSHRCRTSEVVIACARGINGQASAPSRLGSTLLLPADHECPAAAVRTIALCPHRLRLGDRTAVALQRGLWLRAFSIAGRVCASQCLSMRLVVAGSSAVRDYEACRSSSPREGAGAHSRA
jgi:hypothetical protein